MDDETLRRLVSEELSNIPEDIQNDWLIPSARRNGWPPNNLLWTGVLIHRDLDFWKQTVWTVENVDIANALWAEETRGTLIQMDEAFNGNDPTSFFATQEERDRTLSSLKHIFETGIMPGRIALLGINDGYEIIDGHHRYLAFRKSKELIGALNHQGTTREHSEAFLNTLMRKWGIATIATVSNIQQVWVARIPQ